MLYAVRYEDRFASRPEELSHQRALSERLLQWALKEEFGLELSALVRGKGASGKPYFLGCPIQFSVSHTHGLVCCGLSRTPLGVDAESPRPCKEALIQRACNQEELTWLAGQKERETAFLSLWTLKESVMKLEGQGIAMGFQNAAFTFPEGEPRSAGSQVALSQFFLEGGFVVSAAARGHAFSQLCFVDPSELPLS